MPSRALDEVVWSEISAFLRNPERGLAAARQQAQEAQLRLEEVAARRAALDQRRAKLADETDYLLRLARRGNVPLEKVEAILAEVAAEEETVRREVAQLDAQAELAQAELPKMDEVAAVCHRYATYVAGLPEATADERRAILEALEVQVTMEGRAYTITGLLSELTSHGSLDGAGAPALTSRLLIHRASTRCTQARRTQFHRTPRGDT